MAGYQELEQRLGIRKPLVLIPTAYNHVTGAELHARGASMVIRQSRMVRAAFEAIKQTAKITSSTTTARSKRTRSCAPVTELFDAVGVDLSLVGYGTRTMNNKGISSLASDPKTLVIEIKDGTLKSGDQLPADVAIAERFGVNRHTVRQATAWLESEGLLQIERGRGTFVADDVLQYRLGSSTRFTGEPAARTARRRARCSA